MYNPPAKFGDVTSSGFVSECDYVGVSNDVQTSTTIRSAINKLLTYLFIIYVIHI